MLNPAASERQPYPVRLFSESADCDLFISLCLYNLQEGGRNPLWAWPAEKGIQD